MIQSHKDTEVRSNCTEPILLDRIDAIRFFLCCGFAGVLFFSVWLCLGGLGLTNPRPLDTINPNSDPIASLVRLPGIGLSRAIAIVEYRQSHSQNGPAFQTPDDLDAVPGIGEKSIEKMRNWLSISNNERLPEKE